MAEEDTGEAVEEVSGAFTDDATDEAVTDTSDPELQDDYMSSSEDPVEAEFTAATERMSEADHLNETLGGDQGLGAEDLGAAEALQAWSQGGHADDEFEDGDDIAPIQFAQLDAHPVKEVKREDRLHNVMVKITVELGRKYMRVKDLLNVKEQDCIELDKLAGEAFDILINKRAFAEGEIVVVTDLMAVRITRLRESAVKD